MTGKPTSNRSGVDQTKHLLACAPVVRDACALDLLVFLQRHPRALLTNEQLAAFVGYSMKRVATTVDAFVEAGLLERNKNPNHPARMYLLLLNGPQGGGLATLLQLASTRQGRQEILQLLGPGKSQTALDAVPDKRKLHAVA